MSTQLKFTLTIEEANKIFKALGKEPFQDVYELIGKMNEQANAQLATPKPLKVIKTPSKTARILPSSTKVK